MGIFRSQTPRAIFVLHNLITTQTCDFIYGRIRPFYPPVSGLLFLWLTADYLRYFLPIRQAISGFFPLLLSVPRLSSYSFLARSRSSFVGAVFDFPNRSRMTILSNFFSNSFLISSSQLSSSIKWKRSNCLNNSCDICTFLIVSHPLCDGMWQLWRLF